MKTLFVCYVYQMENFLIGHQQELLSRGANAEFFLLDGPKNKLSISRRGVLDIPISVCRLMVYIWGSRPDLVVTITPKAGFLVILTRLLSIFLRCCFKHVHWFTGQVWCNEKGVRRAIMRAPDVLIDKYASRIFLDSHSQVEFLKLDGFKLRDFFVPRMGSICGVADDFLNIKPKPNPRLDEVLSVGVVGRLCEEKGINDLIDWFEANNLKIDLGIKLIFFGRMEFISEHLRERFEGLTAKVSSGWDYRGEVSDRALIYSDIDVLLLCSRREGFSNVLIEAQAQEIPVLVRNIYAVRDSFKSGESGLFFSSREDLVRGLFHFQENENRTKAGVAGRSYVSENFRQSIVLNLVADAYLKTLHLC